MKSPFLTNLLLHNQRVILAEIERRETRNRITPPRTKLWLPATLPAVLTQEDNERLWVTNLLELDARTKVILAVEGGVQ